MSAFLLKQHISDKTYATIAGLRVVREKIEPDNLDITAKGIFVGSAAENQLKSAALAGHKQPYELSFDCGRRVRADFIISSLSYAGDFNGERNYEIRLASCGAVETLQ